jgi:phosphatidylglycerol:prolipoprotein diacylglycerol transferase
MLQSSYAWFCISGYILGGLVFAVSAYRANRRPGEILKVLVVIVLSSLFGAKIFHALFEAEGHALPSGDVATSAFDLFLADPWHWARLLSPGYVFYGGLLSALLLCAIFLWQQKIYRPFQYADFAAPALAIGLAIGRLGCYSVGCCHGRIFDGFGVVPVQLFEAAFALICFLWLMRSSSKDPDGYKLWLFVTLYGVFRFCIEFMRGDDDRGLWFGDAVSTSQIISVLLVLGCLLYDKRPSARISCLGHSPRN